MEEGFQIYVQLESEGGFMHPQYMHKDQIMIKQIFLGGLNFPLLSYLLVHFSATKLSFYAKLIG